MMTSDDLASMYAQIVNGGSKDASKYVTDEESGALWDSIESEVAEMRTANPGAVFSIPNEMPDPDDTADTSTDTAPPDAPPDAPAAETPAAPPDAPSAANPNERTTP